MFRDNADILDMVAQRAFGVSVDQDRFHRAIELIQAEGDAEGEVGRTITVIEAAVPGCTVETDRMNAALDASIDLIRELQNMVATATGKPVRLISRATLSPNAIAVSGSLSLVDEPPTFSALVPNFFVDRCAPPSAFGFTPPPLTDEELAKLRTLGELPGPAFRLVAVMRREALVQTRLDGNAALGVAAVAAAGEILLNTTLLHCAWEEATSPSNGARLLDRQAKLKTTIAKLASRLKGKWSPDQAGPVADFYRAAQLRNRVLHSGYWPTPQELEDGVAALEGLEKFVGDRLCARENVTKYPRTALAWSGPSGLQRRRSYPYWLDALRFDQTEPQWATTFARWRKEVDRELAWEVREHGAVAADCLLYLRRDLVGTYTCFVHDRATGYVAQVSPADAAEEDVFERGKEFLSGLFALYRGQRMIMLPWPTHLHLSQLDWIADFEFLENVSIYPGGQIWSRLQAGGF
jgi:hypothetical protein